jgi:hypothetical protein
LRAITEISSGADPLASLGVTPGPPGIGGGDWAKDVPKDVSMVKARGQPDGAYLVGRERGTWNFLAMRARSAARPESEAL